MKFELGQIVVTATAADLLQRWGEPAETLLARHQAGDWGDLSHEQRRLNDQAVAQQLNLLSTYCSPCGGRLNIFTNAQRSLTLVHLALNGS